MDRALAMWKGVALEGVIFDMDGTLTIPCIDFAGLRAVLGIPRPKDILVEIEAIHDPCKRAWALQVVEDFEAEARTKFQLQPGVTELMRFLDAQGVKKGLITRNSQAAIDHMKEIAGVSFDIELSRAFVPFKPAPDGALHILNRWQATPTACLFVGDGHDDMQAGRSAGMVTVWLDNLPGEIHAHPPRASDVDCTVHSLAQLLSMLSSDTMRD